MEIETEIIIIILLYHPTVAVAGADELGRYLRHIKKRLGNAVFYLRSATMLHKDIKTEGDAYRPV